MGGNNKGVGWGEFNYRTTGGSRRMHLNLIHFEEEIIHFNEIKVLVGN